MEKQERKFTLAEVHTKTGTRGEVQFDQALLDVLGVRPSDFLIFTISQDGVVTIAGEKKTAAANPVATPPGAAGISPIDVTQPALFDAGQPIRKLPKHRRLTP